MLHNGLGATPSCCRFRPNLGREGEEIHRIIPARRGIGEESVINSGNLPSNSSATQNRGYLSRHREEYLTGRVGLICIWSSCVLAEESVDITPGVLALD